MERGRFRNSFSRITASGHHADLIRSVESSITAYFESLEIPVKPTVYDYRVLSVSLRGRTAGPVSPANRSSNDFRHRGAGRFANGREPSAGAIAKRGRCAARPGSQDDDMGRKVCAKTRVEPRQMHRSMPLILMRRRGRRFRRVLYRGQTGKLGSTHSARRAPAIGRMAPGKAHGDVRAPKLRAERGLRDRVRSHPGREYGRSTKGCGRVEIQVSLRLWRENVYLVGRCPDCDHQS
jgi:hypothetical protein